MIFAYYILKVIVCSGILFGYYFIALRNKTFHQWNRFYLLIVAGLSVLLPFIKINITDNAPKVIRYISVGALDESVVKITQQKEAYLFSIEQLGFILYTLICIALFVLALKALKGILNILQKGPVKKIEQIKFIDTDVSGTPFTFFDYLFWNRHIDLNSKTGRLIFNHELAHIQQKHTWDKVFFNLLLILFWINPIFWLMQRELNAIHEFIADKKALEGNDATSLSEMILNTLYPKHHYLLTSPFFQSSINRRLKMFSIKNQKINYMSRILILPLLFMVAAAFTIQQKAQKKQPPVLNQQRLHTVYDTLPKQTKLVVVEEISKSSATKNSDGSKPVIIDVMDASSSKNAKDVFADTRSKIYLEADEIIFKVPANETKTTPSSALLIVNGKKVANELLKEKTIISKKITVYPANDQEAIKLYGIEAARGAMVFEDAEIIDITESALYKELQQDTIPKAKRETPVFTKVEVEPKFAGDWGKFLQQYLKADVPVNNGAPAGQYTVIAQFIVDDEGNISDLKTITNHGYGMEEEVLRVMKLSPNWIPGEQNGRKVTAYRKQPVTFVISKE